MFIAVVENVLAFTVFKTVSCDKILQRDCPTLYSAVGHSLCTQFTRPFSLFVEVSLACDGFDLIGDC